MAAAGLCALALLWMTVLILLRQVHQRREQQRQHDRKALEKAFVALLQGASDSQEKLKAYTSRARLMAEALLDFLSLVRGRDRELVLSTLEQLDVPQTLRRRLSAGSLAGRQVCLEALAAFPGEETEAALRAEAQSPRPEMRLAALRSLHQTRGEIPLAELLLLLRTGELPTSPLVGEFLRALIADDPSMAAQALRDWGLPAAVEVLLIDGLASAGDYAVLPTLMEAAVSPAAEVRAAAVSALGALNHPAAEPVLGAALHDDAWEVRASAAQAIGNVRLTKLSPNLVEVLSDSIWRVRFLAANSLLKLGPEGRRQLQLAAADSTPIVAETAALALAEQGGAG